MRFAFLILISSFIFINNALATDYCDSDAVGCWLMEDTGAESDESGNSADLTASGTVSRDADKKFGSYSRSFSSGSYLYRADGGSTDINGADQAFSIVLWIKPGTLTRNNLVSKTNFNSNQRSLLTYVDTAGHVRIILYPSGTSTGSGSAQTADSLVAEDTWSHVAFVYDDTTLKIYINGDEEASTNYSSGLYNSNAQFQIGERADGGDDPYDGLIDDVGLFDRALSESEIDDIIANGLTTYSTPATSRRFVSVN
jgi:hypothetical protein